MKQPFRRQVRRNDIEMETTAKCPAENEGKNRTVATQVAHREFSSARRTKFGRRRRIEFRLNRLYPRPPVAISLFTCSGVGRSCMQFVVVSCLWLAATSGLDAPATTTDPGTSGFRCNYIFLPKMSLDRVVCCGGVAGRLEHHSFSS